MWALVWATLSGLRPQWGFQMVKSDVLLQMMRQPQMLATLHVCLANLVEAQHVHRASKQQHIQTAMRYVKHLALALALR